MQNSSSVSLETTAEQLELEELFILAFSAQEQLKAKRLKRSEESISTPWRLRKAEHRRLKESRILIVELSNMGLGQREISRLIERAKQYSLIERQSSDV